MTTKTVKPLEDLSDKALRERLARGEQVLAELEGADARDVVRAGKADENLEQMRSTIASLGAVEAELARRGAESGRERVRSLLEAAPLRRRWRDEADERKALQERTGVLSNVLRFGHPELAGERLDPERLGAEQVASLKTPMTRKLALGFGDDVAPLTEDETAEYERLVGIAAGDEDLFSCRREEAAAKAKLAEIAPAPRASAVRVPRLAVRG